MLEELSTSYRSKRTWRWNGHQWQSASARGESYLSIALGLTLLLLTLGLLLALGSATSSWLPFWAIVLLLALLPALMALLAYRR